MLFSKIEQGGKGLLLTSKSLKLSKKTFVLESLIIDLKQ